MAPSETSNGFASNELFRYVRISPPKIIDLQRRAQAIPQLRTVLSKGDDAQRAWAEKYLESKQCVTKEDDLKLTYPAADGVKSSAKPDEQDGSGKQAVAARANPPVRLSKNAQSDAQRTLKTALAHKILGNDAAALKASELLERIEGRPHGAGPAALPVLRRFPHRMSAEPPAAMLPKPERDKSAEALRKLGEDVQLLWRARNKRMKAQRTKLLMEEKASGRSKSTPAKSLGGSKKRSAKKAKKAARAYVKDLRTRRRNVEKAVAAYREVEAAGTIPALLSDDSREMKSAVRALGGERKLRKLQKDIGKAMRKLDVEGVTASEVYDNVMRKLDGKPTQMRPPPLATLNKCFAENPRIKFGTHIRPMGTAQLVKVEETFIKYTEGEINYVENILAGETRRREIKDTKYSEQLTETATEDVSEVTEEVSSKVSSDLRSQIETELNTQFNTDVNATASGSGGGSIGVVDFDGSAALNAGFGIGVDTSLSTSTENNFAQEILNKSIEKTKTTALSRRVDRSYALYETTNFHEIKNTDGNEIRNRRGVYCFLDKHVCISETTYGNRVFLMANVMLPGKNLVCEQQTRRTLELGEIGAEPVFDITPDDIQPGTYKDLVGRYNASNVSPPPDPLINVARTYKTDQTNADMDKGGGFDLKKVAEVLVPLFEQYQRHLVTDTINIPDGYEVQEVCVMVNHGANGVSVPAHLPITVAGAMIYSMPLMAYTALFPLIYLPITVWQIAYLSSPLLHYNVDSSNVTVSVGTESQDSPYFFFEPAVLIEELFEMLGNFVAIGPGILEAIRNEAEALFTNLQTNAAAIPPELVTMVRDALNGIIEKINTTFNSVIKALDPMTGEPIPTPGGELKDIGNAMTDLAQSIALEANNLETVMGDMFAPVKTFFDNIFVHIQEGVEDSVSEFFALLMEQSQNSQKLCFEEAYGARRELPISFNAITIKPGITINVVACLRRTDEALDRWRLETFGTLYQAYLQQVAEYESRNFSFESKPRLSRSPGTMRQEEHRALKEILLHALNTYHGNGSDPGNQYTLDRINLFENAIDWDNVSYKLHNYGPNMAQVQMDRLGLFAGADSRRKAFMTAHWAQVMIPLQPNDELVRSMLAYFQTGEANLEGYFDEDELTALYQALVQDRALLDEDPDVTYRPEILPTDLVVLKLDDKYPSNPDTGCRDE